MRLVLLVCLFVAHSALAQEHPRFDIDGGYTEARPTAIDRKLGAINTFTANGEGSSFEHDLEIGAQLELPISFMGATNLALSLTYIRGNGEFKSNPFANDSVYRVTSSDERIHIEGTLRQDFLQWLFFGTGLWANYRTSEAFREYLFANDSESLVKDGPSLGTPRFHFGVPFVLGSNIAVTKRLRLTPEIAARVDVEEILRGIVQDEFSLGGRLALSYDLTPPKEEPPIASPEPPAHLRATVHFEAGGVSATRVAANASDTVYHRYVMLPARYEESTTPLPAPGASLQDIIASEAAIIIERRAQLRDSAADTRIFAPYVDQWKETSAVLPNITISKYIESEAGVRSWRVDIRKNGDAVASLSDDSSLSNSTLERVFGYSRSNRIDTIVATLQAIDVKGNTAADDDTLIVAPSVVTATIDATVDKFYIIWDSASSVSSWRSALLSKAAHTATPKSRIQISALDESGRAHAHQIASELLALFAKERLVLHSVQEASTEIREPVPAAYLGGVLITVTTPSN